MIVHIFAGRFKVIQYIGVDVKQYMGKISKYYGKFKINQ